MTTAIEADLTAWSQRLHPVRIDLVGDYAGQELFFIEGDSLLRLAFGDGRIDMDSTCVCVCGLYTCGWMAG